MGIRHLVGALTIYSLAGSVQPGAQESLVTHNSLAPAIVVIVISAVSPSLRANGF